MYNVIGSVMFVYLIQNMPHGLLSAIPGWIGATAALSTQMASKLIADYYQMPWSQKMLVASVGGSVAVYGPVKVATTAVDVGTNVINAIPQAVETAVNTAPFFIAGLIGVGIVGFCE